MPDESSTIRRAAVIGAGTMGAAIAAHLTNAGIPTLLLDVPARSGDRNDLVVAGRDRARRSRPPAFMDWAFSEPLLALGNTGDDLGRLGDADWIIEAIVEKPEAKQRLWEEVERQASPQAIFSSNSSGIPMAVQSEGRGADFKRRFLGAHFYNPPRYLYLLELIPTAETSPEVLETVRAFGDRVLGKGIVVARDVPGFIGNRLGIYALLHTVRVMEEMGLAPDVVDALTGPILGRPRSATLRTADTVGIDVLGLISQDLLRATGEDFALPGVMQRLLERGWLGEKSGSGFYRRRKEADGSSTILTLDLATMEYEARGKPDLPELAAILRLPTAGERTRALLALETPAGEFTRRTLYEMIRYSAEKHGIVAETYQDIDRALQWGFGWELGPFGLCDALGTGNAAAAIAMMGRPVPPILRSNRPFYTCDGGAAADAGLIVLSDWKRAAGRVVATRPGASLVDLGDGVLLLEFHSKANSLGQDAYEMVAAACARRDFLGLVIGNQGPWFSAGADLGALLRDARAGDRASVEAMIASFQTMTTRLRAAPFPVVAAPFNMTLGGGCEILLYSDAVQAHAELATGLVELNVGLMPSGGGTTEMLARFSAQAPPGAEPFAAVERTFGLIRASRVSGSALEARRLGFLRPGDGITMNRRRLLGDAKAAVLALAPGYAPPAPRALAVLGEPAYERLVASARESQAAGQCSEYDVHLAAALARILSGGGPGAPAASVPEQRLLELEREVFVELCFRPETQARIEHMLAKGKPLRN